MKDLVFTQKPILFLSLIIALSLTACAGDKKPNNSIVSSTNHPTFLRERIATSTHYKPTGLISNTNPTFTWPKTRGATEYLLGHEDADTSTRWYEYTLTATAAHCDQEADTHCSYTPNDVTFEQNDEKAWWVKPFIPGTVTQWSDTHVFKYANTVTPQTTAQPISPAPETATTELTPTFTWSMRDNSATQYQIGYEDDAGTEWASFSFSSNQIQCNTNHQCSYTPTPSQALFNNGDIKTWWIRDFTNNAWSDWSEGATFNIDTSQNPEDLLVITHDDLNETRLFKSKNNTEFLPRYTLDSHYNMWVQAITVLDNGFYLMTQNIKTKNPATGKNEDTYILFNLLAPNGKSVANKRLDYASHGQDLSLEKIADNQYYVYTRRENGKGIARFIMDTSNIDFNATSNNGAELTIAHNRDIPINNRGASTPSLNVEQDKFALVSYTSRKVLDIQVIDKETFSIEKRFDLDLSDGRPNGNYNQGIAMKDNIIYIARGDWGSQTADNIKKLYLLDATNGELITSFSFTLQNAKSYKTIEPEGLVIIENKLFVMLPIRKAGKTTMKLYKLLDI